MLEILQTKEQQTTPSLPSEDRLRYLSLVQSSSATLLQVEQSAAKIGEILSQPDHPDEGSLITEGYFLRHNLDNASMGIVGLGDPDTRMKLRELGIDIKNFLRSEPPASRAEMGKFFLTLKDRLREIRETYQERFNDS